MVATPPPAEPPFVPISAIVFPSEDDNPRVDRLCTCALAQPVADGRMAAPIEASSAHSSINPQYRGIIPDQSTTIDIGQDLRPSFPPQHPLLQSLLKVSSTLFI